jgi:hypothetical protein
MEKEEIIKEIEKIRNQEGKTYVSNIDEYDILRKKEKMLRELEKPFYKKYLLSFPIRNGNWIKAIKPSVKQGIKRGLDLKYLNWIYEEDIIEIVRIIIKKDLNECKERKILLEDILKIKEKLSELEQEINSKREELSKKRKELEYELNKEEIEKEKAKQKKREETRKKISSNLPINKIIGEIEKGLVIEELK